jgi:hypothetical protein
LPAVHCPFLQAHPCCILADAVRGLPTSRSGRSVCSRAGPRCQASLPMAPWLRSIWRHAGHTCNTVHSYGGRAPLCYSQPQQLIAIDCIDSRWQRLLRAPASKPTPQAWLLSALAPRHRGCLPRGRALLRDAQSWLHATPAAWLDHACSRCMTHRQRWTMHADHGVADHMAW